MDSAALAVVIGMPKLKSRKREMFAIEVAAMTPLAQAYTSAGYKDSPWARYNASKLAHVPQVAKRIDELMTEFSDRSGIRAEYLQRRMLPLLEANAVDFYETVKDPAGNKVYRLRALTDLPRDLQAAIKAIDIDETGRPTKIVLHDKVSVGTTLLRSVGGLTDKAEIGGKDGATLTLEAIVLKSFRKAHPAGDATAAGSPGEGPHGGGEPEIQGG